MLTFLELEGRFELGYPGPSGSPVAPARPATGRGKGCSYTRLPCPVLLLPRLLDGCRQSSIWSEQGPTEINSSESTQEVRAKDGIGPC